MKRTHTAKNRSQLAIHHLLLIICASLIAGHWPSSLSANAQPADGSTEPSGRADSAELGAGSGRGLAEVPPRRVNIPYLPDEVTWAQTAIFWFGKNEQGVPSRNYTDVRAAYTAEALRIRTTVVDYYLWYKVNRPPPMT